MNEKKTILIVEDDKYIVNFMSMTLKDEGYGYYVAKSVKEAISLFYANQPDMILLDLGLPDGEGLEVVKHVRELSNTPIIVVSARQEEQEKIQALDAGADDYVTKPFYMGELMARIRVAMRKMEKMAPDSAQEMFHQDYLTVDYTKRSVQVDGEEIHLTPIEYKILTLLISNRGKVLSHYYILIKIWVFGDGGEAGTLRVFMATLRRKIEKNPAEPRFIVTEVGVGYRFKE